MADVYKYSDLKGPTAFRAIKLLLPAKSLIPFSQKTLRIEIVEIDVSAPVPYDALSYTWGVSSKSTPNRRIIVETNGSRRGLWIHKPTRDGAAAAGREWQ